MCKLVYVKNVTEDYKKPLTVFSSNEDNWGSGMRILFTVYPSMHFKKFNTCTGKVYVSLCKNKLKKITLVNKT